MKRESKYKVPTIEQIRKWDAEELTDLRWAYEKVRKAQGHDRVFVENWFRALVKRINIVVAENKLKNIL